MSDRDVSRRAFVALPAAAFLANARAQSPNDTVRVAFIGLGNRGAFLLKHMKTVPGVKVVALCDINPETLAKAAAATPGAESVADYRKLLDRSDIDAIVIATPVDTHKTIVIAALDSAKNVYSEKPMALTPEECSAMLATAKSAKGIYQAGFQLRHDPNRRAAIEFIRKGGTRARAVLPGLPAHRRSAARNRLVFRRQTLRQQYRRAGVPYSGPVHLGNRRPPVTRHGIRRHQPLQGRPSRTHHLRQLQP